ncbi:MAG: hypothetical protein Q8O64_06450 [Sideroxyarcus sp.]|nr:hypothetical protein [Sideroxyarcus sp.]
MSTGIIQGLVMRVSIMEARSLLVAGGETGALHFSPRHRQLERSGAKQD